MDGPSQESNPGPTVSNSEPAERPLPPIADNQPSKFAKARRPLSGNSGHPQGNKETPPERGFRRVAA